jgi:hypothetical protein
MNLFDLLDEEHLADFDRELARAAEDRDELAFRVFARLGRESGDLGDDDLTFGAAVARRTADVDRAREDDRPRRRGSSSSTHALFPRRRRTPDTRVDPRFLISTIWPSAPRAPRATISTTTTSPCIAPPSASAPTKTSSPLAVALATNPKPRGLTVSAPSRCSRVLPCFRFHLEALPSRDEHAVEDEVVEQAQETLVGLRADSEPLGKLVRVERPVHRSESVENGGPGRKRFAHAPFLRDLNGRVPGIFAHFEAC